jgi:hypothetical protein
MPGDRALDPAVIKPWMQGIEGSIPRERAIDPGV